MADVELVVRLDQETLQDLYDSRYVSPHIKEVFRNATSLPKGHKRLIEDNFKVGPVFDEEGNRTGYQYVTQEELNNAETIIEADREEQK